ncbi:hypothetical protein LJC32_05455 [Oscillospiraceae bacterium OttesenSCG-928-F05]|nr:hypothetical protein [Oscillospiraceae bacterium OttesenSCG-928-F05]
MIRTAKDALKNIALLILAVSTCLLTYRTWVYDETLIPQRMTIALGDTLALFGVPSGTQGARPIEPSAVRIYTEALSPAAIAVTFPGGGRYMAGYDTGEAARLYARFHAHIGEAIGSAGEPRRITALQWREALLAPGVYIDYGGRAPLSAIARWTGAEAPAHLGGTVSRLLLAFDDEGGTLYYMSESDGFYYAAASAVTGEVVFSKLQLLSTRDFLFACQSPAATGLDPDCPLPVETPRLPDVRLAVPDLSGDAYTALLEAFHMNPYTNYGYTQNDGSRAIVSGGRTLTLSADGYVVYTDTVAEGEAGISPDAGLLALTAEEAGIELSASLLQQAVAPLLREGQICLLGTEEAGSTVTVTYGYRFSGAPVVLARTGGAARFTFENGRLVSSSILIRAFEGLDSSARLMPATVAAALADTEGARLTLGYVQGGSDTISALWLYR